ncbi:MAG: 16S rRNA (uracil(1498)-N(3))-methyltransferase [Acholeplasmatales bacterium]|nr:16S rRNA (uracil(1498)-N(3))-methyltransferase [Acholeplasmatales bacterium]
MQKYFISEEDFANNRITSDDVFHIKNVMRGKIGDEVLVGCNGKSYLVKLTKISSEVNFEIVEEKIGNHELPISVSIYQGYPKSDKIEEIIKHSTELGATSIVPTLMKRSVFKLDEKKKDSKLIRFQRIAKEAAEQSFRDVVPEIKDIVKLNRVDFSAFNKRILCFEEDAKEGEASNFKSVITSLEPGDNVAVVIGPEGGIDLDEVEWLKSQGFVSCAVGPRILRTETVVFYVLSAISYEMELKK